MADIEKPPPSESTGIDPDVRPKQRTRTGDPPFVQEDADSQAAVGGGDNAGIADSVQNIKLDDPASQVVRCNLCAEIFHGVHAALTFLGHASLIHGSRTADPAAPASAHGRGGGPKQPNLVRPSVSDQCSPAAWANFIKEWDAYVTTSNITAQFAPSYFLACLGHEVKATLFRQFADPNKQTIDNLIDAARTISVLHVPTGQRRFNAIKLQQSAGEKITGYYTCLRRAVLDCNLTVEDPDTG